ncbi:MAG: type I restriction enzyme HsdR N-terminal domain-containing protein, partial [Spirochaetaceae bacterium]|nr:type I restriction enzyme HsdR N-terminal domain-containing protein [Spirochaetaceae bacterium]
MTIKERLFGALDFGKIETDKDFKEASVRAVVIDPILKELGFTYENILREKSLQSPFLRTGSRKRKVNLIPDYALKVGDSYAWVLDAKAPGQRIIDDDNVEQAYIYAVHPEIRAKYFALCNGLNFACWRTTETEKPVLYFSLNEIDSHWEVLRKMLSSDSFQSGKTFSYEKPAPIESEQRFDYGSRPLLEEIKTKKQQVKRHFGCNAYFTRQSWDIVKTYIKNFSQKGDVVLDPFGGSGVTAIEAIVIGRKAVHVDLNPLSVFMTKAMLFPAKREELMDCFTKIKDEYIRLEPKTNAEIDAAIKKYKGPKDLPLPKGSDVQTVKELFTDEQLAQLALLKSLITKQKNESVRLSLLLAFYNTVSVINKTFHETPKGGGNHFGYYYRYRIAPHPANKSTMQVFENKFKRVYNGKK